METIRHNIAGLTKLNICVPQTDSKINLIPPNVVLAVVSKLIPSKKILRINLPHRPSDLSICLLVRDINKTDYDKTVASWKRRWHFDSQKTKLSPPAIPSVTFLPLRELKLAYQPYAAKRRLAASFDVFLADKRIVHHLPSKLGKSFYSESAGKMPIPISLTNCNLVDAVTNQLNTVLFAVRGNGTTDSAVIGNVMFGLDQLKENILTVCEKICSDWPGGGLTNVRSIYVQTPSSSIPIFFDPSEAPLSQICANLALLPKSSHKRQSANLIRRLKAKGVEVPTKNLANKVTELHKGLTPRLLAQVAEDLPLPAGGLAEILGAKNFKRPVVKLHRLKSSLKSKRLRL